MAERMTSSFSLAAANKKGVKKQQNHQADVRNNLRACSLESLVDAVVCNPETKNQVAGDSDISEKFMDC